MKILQVTHVFKPLWESGGMARVAYEISRGLVERGHELTVYTTNRSFYSTNLETNKQVCLEGMKIYYFENLRKYFPWKTLPPLPYYLPFIARKEIKNFDIVHIHGYRTILSVIVHHYAKKYGIPYVLQPHGSLPRIIEKQRLKKLYDWVWGNRILRDASKLIAVSKEEAEYARLMGVGGEKISVIYNGMDIESFKNLPEYGRFKEKYGIGGKMILYLGRIHKSKGIDIVINAYSQLIKEINEDIAFVIAGSDDGYKAELEKLIKKLNLRDKIKFTGFVDEGDKISAYVDADLFVHTVQYMGGVGLTPLEAILCGTPIIVTEECGEVVKEANCGYLVKYGDVHDLKEKMKLLLQRPELGQQMVERGKKYILKNLAWDKVLERVLEVYLEAMGGYENLRYR
ncbi:glycosyltransferase [Methanophagales archaeon]|nr:MAG: glycosyltransferase [Methanophagales archaeon]